MARLRLLLAVACLLAWLFGTSQALAVDAAFDPKPFITMHCVRCHGDDVQKGDHRFDSLSSDFASAESLEAWQEILDAVNLGNMPPEGEPQLPVDEVKTFVAGLTDRLALASRLHGKEDKPHFRRLNRYEYRNTVRDLCGVNIESFDPTISFPRDERVDGFDNIGRELVISDYLFERYLNAASVTIDKAAVGRGETNSQSVVFSPDDMCDRRFQFRPQIMFQVNRTGKYVDVGHGDQKSDRLHSQSFNGVPIDGFYTIRIEAEAVGRVHPYEPSLLGVDPNEPIKMEVLVADLAVGGRLSGNPTDRSIAIVPLKDNRREVYEYRVWLDKGYSPLVRYINGPQPIKGRLMKLVSRYHRKNLPSNYRSGTDKRPAEELDQYMSDVYEGPRMRVYLMEIEGPYPVPLKQSSRYALFGEQADSDSIHPDKTIKRFLGRAFRRPPLESEVKRYLDYYNVRLEQGDSAESALLTTFKAILCSPNFLYIETPPEKNAAITQSYRLASRLSYFLWSSMPDDELLQSAAQGDLKDPRVLAAQVERMLEDPKSRAFTEHFTDSWLRLNDLGSMPPDNVKFKVYYERLLQPLMKEETRLFFADVLKNNLSIERFIDSDFTYLNRYMADHYGVAGIKGDAFQKAVLPSDSKRGGLLGQASVLTVTSNGVETSPVTRGIWVLENILGAPPAAPPPDVDPLEPDTRGATTIREQLMKHRKVQTCAECHRKIDPLGFAFEKFDPIGAYREKYYDGEGKPIHSIDTAGRLATGEKFGDLAELKSLLLERKDQFARCLTEKMLRYALGRELNFQDRPQVESITNSLAAKGYGVRDLIELVVLSAEFRNEGEDHRQKSER